MQGSDPQRRPSLAPLTDTIESSMKRVRHASPVFLIGVALAVTFQLACQLLRPAVARPRPRRAIAVPRPALPRLRAGRAAAPPVAPPGVLTPQPAAFVETRPQHAGAFAAFHYPPFVIYFMGLMCGV